MYEYDRFGGAAAWDRYCAEQDERRKWQLMTGTCGKCGHCEVPPSVFKNPERMGYCKACGEFVCLDDCPNDIDCEEFT